MIIKSIHLLIFNKIYRQIRTIFRKNQEIQANMSQMCLEFHLRDRNDSVYKYLLIMNEYKRRSEE